jgi:hypothetical protein
LKNKPYLPLLLLTFSALLVHGYHPAAEDGEIYLPGIKKILNPALYPFGDEFFMNHARMSLFPKLIAASVRLSHLSFDLTVFLWYFAALFLTLLAAWQWSGEFFEEMEARWAGVALLATMLTLPVAGTALYISDQYLTSRTLVLFALLFATRHAWRGEHVRFVAWSAFAVLVHPLMAVFGISFGLILALTKRFQSSIAAELRPIAAMSLLPLLPPESEAYRDALHTRSYFFLLQWSWYEWLGIVGPLAVLWWLSRASHRDGRPAMALVSWCLIVYGLLFIVAGFVLVPRPMEILARLQPMRSFHLLYTFMIVLGGGFLGAKLLKRRVWRWALCFAPLAAGMFFAQCELFSASPHIEWPGVAPTNDWLRAFDWIRQNTPRDAVFAIDPSYMLKDDEHGFRAIAERSRLADAVKDSGAVTMFPNPPFSEDWLGQITDENGWSTFQSSDLHRLKTKYGVNWAVLEHPGLGLDCPYRNNSVMVCRVD